MKQNYNTQTLINAKYEREMTILNTGVKCNKLLMHLLTNSLPGRSYSTKQQLGSFGDLRSNSWNLPIKNYSGVSVEFRQIKAAMGAAAEFLVR